MKSVNGINWKPNNIPERLILKNKQKFNISYLLSKIFLDKNYSDEEIYNSIYKFKENSFTYENHDFIDAAKIILDCYNNKKKILIFGDYDVDGYSSIYLLYDYLTKNDINCDYYIPNRLLDGYGPNKTLLKKLISKKFYSLIIFVDCGTNSINEIDYLESIGLKSIVIDHHQIYEQKKKINSVIINPLKNPFDKQNSIFCATTLVYLFINYLIKTLKLNKNIDLSKYLFFSAIATICDQMPLRGYNRTIVKDGLNNFDLSKFKKFSKLINIKHKLNSNDIGFYLGPILNSASRLGHSNLPFSLLVEKKVSKINNISDKLLYLNNRRKKIQHNIFYLLNKNLKHSNTNIIFNYKENINEGLLGIIAANFVELYNKPCFILTKSNNIIKCSARSIIGFNIGNILNEALNNKIIIKGGGHSMAGGCVLEYKKLDEFKKFLNHFYKKKFKNLINIKYFVSEQNFNSLKVFSRDEIKILEPFGNDNTNPFFLIRKCKIIKYKIIQNSHIQLIIKNNLNKSCMSLAFNVVGTNLGDILMNYKKEIDRFF